MYSLLIRWGNTMDKDCLLQTIHSLKKIAKKEIKKGHWSHVLSIINLLAVILYESNPYYKDDDLEWMLSEISKLYIDDQDYVANDNLVVFYDGFGLNNRGLAQIYLQALCKYKKVIYVTYERAKDQIPDIRRILSNNEYPPLFLNGRTNLENIQSLCDIIRDVQPKHFFFYSTPYDVVGTTALYAYKGKSIRYQIDLTDHAFWLGAQAIDISIEFRNYGAYISNVYRDIPKEKIVCIPYYPIINNDTKFNGFPFRFHAEDKVVFSGGSLYKTLGDENKYYTIVRYILDHHKDVIFWYAGSGDDTEIKKILNEYPGRAFHTDERSDLFEVLKNSYMYLSTYPVCGGLMFQYAALAGKIPITLKNSSISDDFLLNQEKLNIEFYSLDDLYNEIDKILNDQHYHDEKEKEMISAVITPDMFNELVSKLLEGRLNELVEVKYLPVETESFRHIYIDRITNKKLDSIIVQRETLFLAKYMPIVFCKGIYRRIMRG